MLELSVKSVLRVENGSVHFSARKRRLQANEDREGKVAVSEPECRCREHVTGTMTYCETSMSTYQSENYN